MFREFTYRGAELSCEDVSLGALAREFGTPLYVYSEREIVNSFEAYKAPLAALGGFPCVSIKANSNLSLLKILADRGAGFDVVSGGELARVLAIGADPNRVVFAGVGKSRAELEQALKAGILMLNVESVPELELVNSVAGGLGVRAPVAIRVNPDVDAKTHPSISTGLSEHKFGVPFAEALECYSGSKKFSNIDFVGVDCHVGSMINDLGVFQETFLRVSEFVTRVREVCPSVSIVDLGGGLAVSYSGEESLSIERYLGVASEVFAGTGLKVLAEPGRSIFAAAGALISEVQYIKQTSSKSFLIVDAGFTELLRPALYEAHHEILPLHKSAGKFDAYDVVGPVCESTDCFASARRLSTLIRGDLVAFMTAGAYGFSMASNYNTRPRPAEVLVSGSSYRVIRPREEVRELFQSELALLK